MLLPQLNDAQGNPRSLAVGAGKDGNIYVVDQHNMGQYNATSNAVYQQLTSVLGKVYSSPAWFNGTMYYSSVGTTLNAYPFTNGMFQGTPSSQSAISFAFPGTTPSISAKWNFGNGIVWAAREQQPRRAARLRCEKSRYGTVQ